MLIRALALVLAIMPVGWALTCGADRPGSQQSATRIPAARATAARQAASRLAAIEGPRSEGWSKSPVDPALMLQAFDTLRLKPGMVLRAYLFTEGGNGNGVVWALPEGTPVPDPISTPGETPSLRNPPKPPGALDDAMQAIEGDRSPWSYLSASLLARQFKAFGAEWHGASWATHEILGANPITAATAGTRSIPIGKPGDWRWSQPAPADWNPSVAVGPDSVVVVFYTYTALGQQAIIRHTDTFKPGSCTFVTQTDEMASGPGGFVF